MYRVFAVLLLGAALFAQTKVDLARQTGNVDFTGLVTKPFQSGASLPGTCTVGQMFWLTTATAGQNLYGCTTTNTWTLEGGTVGLADPGGNGPIKRTSLNVTALATSGDIVGLFTGCSGILSLGADGACHAGGGWASAQNNLGNITGAVNLATAANTNESYTGTLTGNVTFTFSPGVPTAGAKVRFTLTQDGTGNRVPTMPAGFSTFPAIYPKANCTTTINGNWDGAAFNLDGALSYCGAQVPETAAPTTTPGSGQTFPWTDSTDHLQEYETSTGVVYKFDPFISPTSIQYKDDFPDKGVGTSSGNIGELLWGFSCPTGVFTGSVAGHPGIFNLQAGAVATNACVFRPSGSGAFTNLVTALNSLGTNQTWEYLTVFQITSGAIATQTVKGGFGSADGDTGTTCAGNCIQWFLDTSVSGNFQLLTCAAGVCTTTGASAGAITAAINTWYQIRIFSTTSGTVQMEVRQSTNTQTQSTTSNIPSGGMTLYYYLKNNNTQPSILLDYVHFRETNLARF